MLQQSHTRVSDPLGSPATIAQMLDFVARHDIEPVTEMFDFSHINDAIAHLEAGKARYRIVLKHVKNIGKFYSCSKF